MIPLPITLLFLLTLTGMALVPESVIPIFVWPLVLGLGNLSLVLIHSFSYHALLDEDMAPLLTAVFALTLAVTIPFEHPRRGISFLIAFVMMLVAGVIWSAWKATKESSKPSDPSKH